MRALFLGSPLFAVPSLEVLAREHQVVGVVTQPDRPAGRGRVLRASAVKIAAQRLGLPLVQARRISSPEALEQLRAWAPELVVVAAFGQILKPELLDLPRHGCLNVHASLLPRWRGAAPIPAAILHGDPVTGVSLMRMDAGVDTGPVLAQARLNIASSDTTGSLTTALAALGARLLAETLPAYLDGSLLPLPQDDSQATYAPVIRKPEAGLDLTLPAADLERRVRAFDPWPGAFLFWGRRRLILRRGRAEPRQMPGAGPGRALVVDGLPAAGCADGILVFERIQPEGKPPMSGQAFLQGNRGFAGSFLTTSPVDRGTTPA